LWCSAPVGAVLADRKHYLGSDVRGDVASLRFPGISETPRRCSSSADRCGHRYHQHGPRPVKDFSPIRSSADGHHSIENIANAEQLRPGRSSRCRSRSARLRRSRAFFYCPVLLANRHSSGSALQRRLRSY
jgi:hypothetical protein